MYLPVIHAEVRVGADFNTITGDVVEISSGTVLGSKMFGMDWDGSTYFNFRAKEGGVLKNSPMPLTPLIDETPHIDNTVTEPPATTTYETSMEPGDSVVPSEVTLP